MKRFVKFELFQKNVHTAEWNYPGKIGGYHTLATAQARNPEDHGEAWFGDELVNLLDEYNDEQAWSPESRGENRQFLATWRNSGPNIASARASLFL